MRGYTLIELLVVISMMAILSMIAFASFKDFSSDQVAIKALGQIQSGLKQAQSNATAGVICAGVSGAAWSTKLELTTFDIKCSKTADIQRTYSLDNATISIKCSPTGSDLTLPVTINYASLNGKASFTGDPGDVCLTTTNSLVITVTNSRNTASFKSFTISKGGAIDVQ